jgi:Tfp pilus assembly protein PilO
VLNDMLKSLQSRDLLATLEGIKVKPSTMLMALGGILLLAYIVVGAAYVKERQDQSSIRQQIEAGGGTLSGVGNPQQTLKDLQEQLAYRKEGLANLEKAFPTKLDSTLIMQSLLDYAAQSDVVIRQMNALPASEVAGPNDSAVNYAVLRYSLVVDGGLPEMLSFVSQVESGAGQTASVGDVSVAQAAAGLEMTLGVSFYARSENATATGASPPATPAPSKQSTSNQG